MSKLGVQRGKIICSDVPTRIPFIQRVKIVHNCFTIVNNPAMFYTCDTVKHPTKAFYLSQYNTKSQRKFISKWLNGASGIGNYEAL